jgi:hypothetical protein
MDIETFRNTPANTNFASEHLHALWLDLNGNWDAAHRIVQQMSDTNAMWIHAYLHRKEPDLANARYWYRSAGKSFPVGMSSEAEAAAILSELAE